MKISNTNYNINSRYVAQPIDIASLELSGKNSPHKFIKYVIEDSYNNRKDILKVARNKAGVYLFITPNGGLYVGSSIELYARIVSYFRPCAAINADRHVLHHLKKHGFVFPARYRTNCTGREYTCPIHVPHGTTE